MSSSVVVTEVEMALNSYTRVGVFVFRLNIDSAQSQNPYLNY